MTDIQSTELVWKLLSTKLRSFILSRVSNEHVADDLVQEVFLRVHQNMAALRDDQRLSVWVYQIARNLIADYYRRNESRPHRVSTDPPTDSGTAANANNEVMEWLHPAIDSLPDKYREALRLYEWEGLPQQEIADRLGVSLSGAKSRIQRGRAKLKDVLHSCCAFEQDARGNILDYSPANSESCRKCCGDTDQRCGD